MKPVIKVHNLSKAYRIGTKEKMADSLFQSVAKLVTAPFTNAKRLAKLDTFNQPDTDEDLVWALKNASFEVQSGEVIGIIGHNGAGKSTLLKILSKITQPTKGWAEIQGRVSSLLEVGTGFHPELTGRDNIYLNGTILGMRKPEIDHVFDAIVEFSGIDKYLDTPIKRYSSGMRVRLAFAVAAHLEPEVLVIDEVLAVGDMAFQDKCLNKMQDVSKSGRTVLFVSHNMAAIRALCTRCILLKQGSIEASGEVGEVVDQYHQQLDREMYLKTNREWPENEAPGNDKIRLYGVGVMPRNGKIIEISSGFTVKIKVETFERLPNLDTTLELRTMDEVIVYHGGSQFTSHDACQPGVYEIKMDFPSYLLNSGRYRIRIVFGQHQAYAIFAIPDVLAFDIEHTADQTMTPRKGIIRPKINYRFQYLSGTKNSV